MKKLYFSSFLCISILFSSCQVIGDIFKAGVWTGVIIVAAIIFIVIWLLVRLGRKK